MNRTDPVGKNRLITLVEKGFLLSKRFGQWGCSLALMTISHSLWALPTGGQVVGGAATIQSSQGAKTTEITQTSQRAAIHWQSFDIAPQESVHFQQPSAEAVTLNRVIGGQLSHIEGQLSSNGQVFLVNPQGIIFGPQAKVDVNGIAASTLDMDSQAFMQGQYVFTGKSSGTSVSQQGVMQTQSGGYVLLLGDQVSNQGSIHAPNGYIAVVSGDQVTLDLTGDGSVQLAVDKPTFGEKAGVTNLGLLDGGKILMTAQVAQRMAGTVVNQAGVIQAQTIEEKGGEIFLSAQGGDLLQAGGLNTSATGNHPGGNITLTSDHNILLEKNSQLISQGSGTGTGGSIIVKADQTLTLQPGAKIEAQGGVAASRGGHVELSGQKHTSIRGEVHTGDQGRLVIDPEDLMIANGTGSLSDEATVYESFLEAQLQQGSSVDLVASHSIQLADLQDNALTGRNANGIGGGLFLGIGGIDDTTGAFLPASSGFVSFADKDDQIVLGNSLEIRAGQSQGYVKIGQLTAPRIQLVAPEEVSVGNIVLTVSSSGSELVIQAGGDLTLEKLTANTRGDLPISLIAQGNLTVMGATDIKTSGIAVKEEDPITGRKEDSLTGDVALRLASGDLPGKQLTLHEDLNVTGASRTAVTLEGANLNLRHLNVTSQGGSRSVSQQSTLAYGTNRFTLQQYEESPELGEVLVDLIAQYRSDAATSSGNITTGGIIASGKGNSQVTLKGGNITIASAVSVQAKPTTSSFNMAETLEDSATPANNYQQVWQKESQNAGYATFSVTSQPQSVVNLEGGLALVGSEVDFTVQGGRVTLGNLDLASNGTGQVTENRTVSYSQQPGKNTSNNTLGILGNSHIEIVALDNQPVQVTGKVTAGKNIVIDQGATTDYQLQVSAPSITLKGGGSVTLTDQGLASPVKNIVFDSAAAWKNLDLSFSGDVSASGKVVADAIKVSGGGNVQFTEVDLDVGQGVAGEDLGDKGVMAALLKSHLISETVNDDPGSAFIASKQLSLGKVNFSGDYLWLQASTLRLDGAIESLRGGSGQVIQIVPSADEASIIMQNQSIPANQGAEFYLSANDLLAKLPNQVTVVIGKSSHEGTIQISDSSTVALGARNVALASQKSASGVEKISTSGTLLNLTKVEDIGGGSNPGSGNGTEGSGNTGSNSGSENPPPPPEVEVIEEVRDTVADIVHEAVNIAKAATPGNVGSPAPGAGIPPPGPPPEGGGIPPGEGAEAPEGGPPEGGHPVENQQGPDEGAEPGSKGDEAKQEEKEEKKEPVVASHENKPLKERPLYDVGGAKVAGQKLVCK